MTSQEAWVTFKKSNMIIHGVKGGSEVKSNGIERLLSDIIEESSPNIEKVVGFQTQETYRTPNKYYQRRISLYYIIVRMSKIQRKDIILKVTREKNSLWTMVAHTFNPNT